MTEPFARLNRRPERRHDPFEVSPRRGFVLNRLGIWALVAGGALVGLVLSWRLI